MPTHCLFKYLLLGSLALVNGELNCNIEPTSGALVMINKHNTNSGWKILTSNADGITAVKIQVQVVDPGIGNLINVMKNWSQLVVSANVDRTTVITIPAADALGELQYNVQHTVGTYYQAEIFLCTGSDIPVPLPTSPPTLRPTLAPVVPTFPPSNEKYQCSVDPISGASLFVPAWWGNSGWRHLVYDATKACGVKVDVVTPSLTNDNYFVLVTNNGEGDPVRLDTSGFVPIPADATGNVHFYINHAVGGTYEARVQVCTNCGGGSEQPTPPTPAPTPAPTPTPVPSDECSVTHLSKQSVPQVCLPEQMGIETGNSYFEWRRKSAIQGNSIDNEDCRDLHDRFFVEGDDGTAYHTWHPPTYQGCVFQHEHGNDPSDSEAFTYEGGYPPFGYVAAQWSEREEDHFGHKVVVANNIKMAIGNSADDGSFIYNAGITCNWLSKIHQGSYSADAISNDLHEYFLTVTCDDNQFGDSTRFSVKSLVQWGVANVFDANTHIFEDASKEGVSRLRNPWDNQLDAIPKDYAISPDGLQGIEDLPDHGGGRGFAHFPGLQWKTWNYESDISEVELWAGPSGNNGGVETLAPEVNGEKRRISFAPYYHVKNPGRFTRINPHVDGFEVVSTIDMCYEGGIKIPGGFCSLIEGNVHPGPDFYKQPESPFTGTVRAVNFKGIELMNKGGPTEWCTDVFGKKPTAMPCEAGEIRHRASSISNYWKHQSWQGDNIPCIKDVGGTCRKLDLLGTLEKWEFGREGYLWVAENVGATHLGGAKYLAEAYTFEWIINQGNAEGVRLPN